MTFEALLHLIKNLHLYNVSIHLFFSKSVKNHRTLHKIKNDLQVLPQIKKNTIDKFTNYEKYLYFESSSYESSSFGQKFNASWPKSNSTKPFLNYSVTSSQVIDWLGNANDQVGQYSSASLYDATNGGGFLNNVPEHIKSDPRNNIMLSFFNM